MAGSGRRRASRTSGGHVPLDRRSRELRCHIVKAPAAPDAPSWAPRRRSSSATTAATSPTRPATRTAWERRARARTSPSRRPSGRGSCSARARRRGVRTSCGPLCGRQGPISRKMAANPVGEKFTTTTERAAMAGSGRRRHIVELQLNFSKFWVFRSTAKTGAAGSGLARAECKKYVESWNCKARS